MTLYNSLTGAETLPGTSGADMFRYDAQADSTTSASDLITFNHAQGDIIDLSSMVLTGTGHPTALHWAGVDPSAGKAWGVWEWGDGSGTLRVDLNGDSVADMNIILRGAPTLVAA